ncbi:hypothetical protein [Rhodonellum sp.]|uniref:hypothetical protein n=1 Tax=Rhodonellum sp. TaxID=2231180 RepID=UPI00271E1B12|nr:hypothetical protein [Rhodonellum sp.]MDO9553275.1 hypothetical protein [Rhodonellum sp.]
MIKKISNSNSVWVLSLLLTFSISFMSFVPKNYEKILLKSGTLIALESAQEINSATVIAGQSIDFFVRTDIKVDDKVVVRKGTVAKGLVQRVQKAKGIGKEGYVEIDIRSLPAVDGSEILLTGAKIYEEGEDKQTLSIVLGVLVCLLFLTMKGKNGVIPQGYSVDARVGNDVMIAVD